LERALDRSPGRFNSLYGAGRAAEHAGDTERATSYYGQLVANCREADTSRPRAPRSLPGCHRRDGPRDGSRWCGRSRCGTRISPLGPSQRRALRDAEAGATSGGIAAETQLAGWIRADSPGFSWNLGSGENTGLSMPLDVGGLL
jgi:hypothetical protein